MEYDNEKRIVAWNRVSKGGKDYLSLAFTLDGKEYSGALFFETDKKSEKSPDLTGKIELKGERVVTDAKPYAELDIKKAGRLQSGYEQAKAKAEELKSRKVDTVLEDIPDEPISLDDIPF